MTGKSRRAPRPKRRAPAAGDGFTLDIEVTPDEARKLQGLALLRGMTVEEYAAAALEEAAEQLGPLLELDDDS